MTASASLLEELTGGRAEIGTVHAPTPTRALAWARVSTSMQEERGLSIPEQLREIREYAEARKIEITRSSPKRRVLSRIGPSGESSSGCCLELGPTVCQ
jgi:alkanesulfonate monooxygenase SsuD/methylene tetrahydromethanopterin reductase-like flavin-dependent oxidoreductase (luciferase family)